MDSEAPRAAQLATILVAEDDPDDRMMTAEAFQECRVGNPLQFVHDGEQLMDYLHARGCYADAAAFPAPGLILLDLNMPRKDGREALREIKSDPRLGRIPVVVLTTSRAERDVASSHRDGADAVMAKPASFDGLVELVRSLGKTWLPPRGPEPDA